MGSREPENLGDVLPDEGDLRPRVEEAIHHHLISVRSVGAGTDGLEASTTGVSSGQKALVGLVRLW
ncbi:hypothetical protein T05_1003 [Trichinella murrelli]|uniref:Uncharacterized protein n=1 Tax=Trichinella murrelli TaxID=144512 RepID=A0A0V0T147_9BILA|nr:hypothetical protein T05_1003 [Trichinella murrelli]